MNPKYLLTDRFVCELADKERKFIRSVSTWKLMELNECLINRKLENAVAVDTSIPVDKRIDENLQKPQIVSMKCNYGHVQYDSVLFAKLILLMNEKHQISMTRPPISFF